jgi:hypothetical protein
MRRLFRHVIAFAAVTSIAGQRGLGCSCAAPTAVCSEYWKTAVVFLGRVTRIDHALDNPPEERIIGNKKLKIIGPGQNLVHFEIAKWYRGTKPEDVVVYTPDQGSACGYGFQEGREYWSLPRLQRTLRSAPVTARERTNSKTPLRMRHFNGLKIFPCACRRLSFGQCC